MRDGSSGPNQGRNASPPITEATGAIKFPAHSNTMLSYSAFGGHGRKQREITEGKSGGRRGEKELDVCKNFLLPFHHFQLVLPLHRCLPDIGPVKKERLQQTRDNCSTKPTLLYIPICLVRTP